MEKIKKGKTGFEKGVETLRIHLKTMPEGPGVYRMLSDDNAVLYVGKAKNLKKRIVSYTQKARQPLRLQRMVAQIRGLEIVVTHTESEALLLEANLIQRHKPPFNVLLRDDKSFPFILISSDHEFPRIAKHRGAKNVKGQYFGPFASGAAVTETIQHLQRAFKLRNCTDSFFSARSRPCLQYHIKRCTAPCVGKVGGEAYAEQVAQAVSFLRGETQKLQTELADEMQKSSDSLDFERAAALRDRIRVLTSIQSRQDVNLPGLGDVDVIALHRQGRHSAVQVFMFRGDRHYGARVYFPSHDGEIATDEIMGSFIGQFYLDKEPPSRVFLSEMPAEVGLIRRVLSEKAGRKVTIQVPRQEAGKRITQSALDNAAQALARNLAQGREQKKLLSRVAEIFGLSDLPERIEVYDNSHLSGTKAVGGMIVAGPEGFIKKAYRKFTIKEADGGDDFGMMREVLTRRLKRLLAEETRRENWPDLLLIDGGAGQVSEVMRVLEETGGANIKVVGIAKGPDRNAGRERFFMQGRDPFSLPENDPVLYYLQRLRDEAHRFVIGAHRAKRLIAIDRSRLDDVPGIGASRKKALLHVFGSAKAVAGAGVSDLERVGGISRSMAKKIYDFFHGGV